MALCAAMKLMSQLVKVSVCVCEQLHTSQRLLATESRKKVQERAAARLEELQSSVSQVGGA